ncbi:MAG: type II toxin-antitoxin system RelE/ParE family toxin [Desulfobacteraceae bacterium]|nr:type II toxin-antitoxin system RelE/ParE family toxin [Desulfobacteraceae bacterium]MBC2719195.1 type II toxin-antitoxin system RelE/ParE family toxin [Desulfobacteraceae bacterium]
MKKLSTKWFKKWSKKVKLSNQNLLDVINALEARLSTADLGHHLFKVRVKREYGGKSSGFRTIILFKADDRAIFLFGFGKNEKENIDKNELQYFKKLGDDLLSLNSKQLETAISQKVLFELEDIE